MASCGPPTPRSSGTTRVGIVEDDLATRERLVRRISPIANVDFAVGSLAQARAAVGARPPEVLLVDMRLPDGDGSDLIAEVRTRHPAVLSLVISVFGDEHTVVRAIRAGARGYLLKDDSQQEIARAIDDLLAGGSPISPPIARHLINLFCPDATGTAAERPAEPLTKRELEVITLASKGYSYVEVAKLLGVSSNTVSGYTKNVYEKLAVRSRGEALFEATKLGLVPPPLP